MTYLDHDHSERENVCFFAVWSFVQYLRCSPPRGETALTLETPHGIQILSDRSETKVRDACVAGVIHEDVWLDTDGQCGGETEIRMTTYSLKISVDHITRVKIAETLGNVGQLVMRVSVG